MKILRNIGSVAFVLGLFTAVFVGIPWHVVVSDDPVVPWWLKIAVFCLGLCTFCALAEDPKRSANQFENSWDTRGFDVQL